MLPVLSRRHFVASTGIALAGTWLTSASAFAAAEPEAGGGIVDAFRREGAKATVTVQPLRGGVSVLFGSGGNIAVHHGDEGMLMVDAGLSQANVRAALDRVGKGPVRYVVNTHWHFDHTDGNPWLHDGGAMIVAHENGRKRMMAHTRVDAWDFTFPPAPRAALPQVALRGPLTLHLSGTAVAVEPIAPGHTDTDVRVTFIDADVVHVGDTWWNGHYPFIDYSTGGSIDGTIRAAEANLDAVTDATIVIPGHGPVGGRRDLTEYRDMLRTIRDAVAALKQQGRSADEVVAAKPTAPYDAKWGTFATTPDAFTRLVYAGV